MIRAGHAVTDMAYFTARDHEPAEYCESMMANATVYVGVVGQRYGTPVRGQPDRSYTELEYDTATALGLPRLVFLTRDDSPLLPAVDQPAEHAARQQAFRRRVLDGGNTVAWVRTPGDLEIGLFQALLELADAAPVPKYPNNLRRLRGRSHTRGDG